MQCFHICELGIPAYVPYLSKLYVIGNPQHYCPCIVSCTYDLCFLSRLCFFYSKKIVHLGNTSIYRSQQGVISDSPNTPFERVGEVSRLSFSHFCKVLWQTPDSDQCHVWGHVLRTAQKHSQWLLNKNLILSPFKYQINVYSLNVSLNSKANNQFKYGSKLWRSQ